MIAWANLHVGFMVGIIPLAAFAAEHFLLWTKSRSRNHLLAAIIPALACAAWLLNPYGVGVLRLPGKINSVPGIHEMLFEWMPLFNPPNNLAPATYLAFAAMLTVAALILITAKQWPRPWIMVTALALLYLTFTARRQLAITSAALPVLVLPYAGNLAARIRTLPQWLRYSAVGLCTAFALILKYTGLIVAGGLPTASLAADAFPTGAVQFLKQHRPPAQIFNSYHYGAYLLYYLGPETKVFIDGRVDTYDPQVWIDDRAIEAGSMTLAQAEAKYHLNTYILDSRPGYDPGQMAARLAADPNKYALVYTDATAHVFVRRAAETTEYLHALGK
jgi:hypothetical protein